MSYVGQTLSLANLQKITNCLAYYDLVSRYQRLLMILVFMWIKIPILFSIPLYPVK